MKKALTDIKVNHKVVIQSITDNPLISKMFEFGLVPGSSVIVLSKAPFKGPISVLVDDSRIALRQAEAKFILVEGE